MPRDMLGDAATLGDGTDTGKARVIMRNGKYPAVPAQSPVFADYAVGDVEQADVGHHARFLAVDVYPLVFVEIGTDILFREVAHIRERQSGERTEQVEVAVQFLFGVFQFPLHQQAYFVFGQETTVSDPGSGSDPGCFHCQLLPDGSLRLPGLLSPGSCR